MSGLENLDIPKLTKLAERGEGCALRESLDKLFYEERLAALKLIEEQNKVNREADSSVTKLSRFTSTPETFYLGGVNLIAEREGKGKGLFQNPPYIYLDRFEVTRGNHYSYCESWDLKSWTKLKSDGKWPRW